MKQFKLKFLLTILISMAGAKASAYDISVENADGVYIDYNYINDGLELEVAGAGLRNQKSVNVVIPDEVVYMNRTRKVTAIAESAFEECENLNSVVIGNNIKTIGACAFYGCVNMTSVSMGNNVKTIGRGAFGFCYVKKVITKSIASWCRIDFENSNSNPLSNSAALYSDENTKIRDLYIPLSVTTIGNGTFCNCGSLESVTIPNSVTTIGEDAFSGCSGLTTVKIGNNVTTIGIRAFYDCYSLESVTIPNSVTSIGGYAFCGCKLSSVTIPSSMTSIDVSAFNGCGLTSVTIPSNVTNIGAGAFASNRLTTVDIPSSVTAIGAHAFDGQNLTTVVSLIENPFALENDVFSKDTYLNATLYVPSGTKEKYKDTEGWKNFLFMEESTGGSDPVTPETKKCEKPTISYQNGRLTFNSETEGASFVSSITDADMGRYSTSEVKLSLTYNISVYATKVGYDNSETVTAKLCWIDQEPKTEGITNGVANVRAQAILIQSESGQLTVEGINDGTIVNVYTINGTKVGSAIVQNGRAFIRTNQDSGSFAIVKIGNKSFKVNVK